MDKRLSPESEAALRKLAREIGGRRRLNDDVLEELYGHLEDKTLGYLSGEESLSEPDAVLLTREHFGNPGAFPELGVKAEPFRSRVSLPRRLAAVAILTMTAGIAFAALKLAIAYSLDASAAVGLFDPRNLAGIWLILALKVAAVYLVLRGWNARERQGRRVWYETYAPSALVLMLCGLGALRWCVPEVTVSDDVLAASNESLLYTLVGMPGALRWTIILLITAIGIVFPMLWIWWADQRSLRYGRVVAAAAAWTALGVASAIPLILVGHPVFELGTDSVVMEVQPVSAAVLEATHKVLGVSPSGPAGGALAYTAVQVYLHGSNVAVTAILYLVLGFGARALWRYGSIQIRWRHATR
jgi:hypothetical protein